MKKIAYIMVLSGLGWLMGAPGVRADEDIYWSGGTGSWHEATNWQGGVVPIDTNLAFVANGGTVQISENAWASGVRIGEAGNGTAIQTAGILQLTGVLGGTKYHLTVGRDGGTGEYELHGGSIEDGNTFAALFLGSGTGSTGIMRQFGGSVILNGGNIRIGHEAGSSGTYILSDGTFSSVGTTGRSLQVGASGVGTFIQSNGVVSAQALIVGAETTAEDSSYTMSGGSLTVSQNISVGSRAVGVSFTQSSGDVTSSDSWIGLAQNVNSEGTYTLSGGTVTALTSGGANAHLEGLLVGMRGLGTFSQEGGETEVANLVFGSLHADGTGIYELKEGTLVVHGRVWQNLGVGYLDFTGGTLRTGSDGMKLEAIEGLYAQNATDGDSLFDVQHNATIEADYNAAVFGSQNTATVSVAYGKTLTLAADTTLTIGAQAVLMGSGTVTGGEGVVVVSGGRLSPGSSTGEIVVDTLSLRSGSEALFEINGMTTAGTDYDRVSGTQVESLNGWNLLVQFGEDMIGQSGTLTLFDYAGAGSGGNADLGLGDIEFVGPYSPDDASLIWDGGTGELTFTSVIPEPGTVGLLAFAFLAFAVRRRRG